MRIRDRDSGQVYVARVGDQVGVSDRSSGRRVARYVRGLHQTHCRGGSRQKF